MTFPKAYLGVKKIFTAHILGLIGAVLLLLTSVFSAINVVDQLNNVLNATTTREYFGIASTWLAIAGSVLLLISIVLYLVGIIRAKADERSFLGAMIFAIILLVVSPIVAIINILVPASTSFPASYKVFFSILQNAAILATAIFTIHGIQSLAKKLDRKDIAKKGTVTIVLLIVLYSLIIVSTILSIASVIALSINLSSESSSTNVLGAFLSSGLILVIASILSVVATIIYLIFLKKSVRMLEA